MGVTSNGLPYPENSDFVADGAMAIKDLADNVNAKAGLWKVIPSGATNGTVGANGDVAVGSAVSTVTVSGAFSSKYENYLITVTGGAGSAVSHSLLPQVTVAALLALGTRAQQQQEATLSGAGTLHQMALTPKLTF
jgi:hypothetical protein